MAYTYPPDDTTPTGMPQPAAGRTEPPEYTPPTMPDYAQTYGIPQQPTAPAYQQAPAPQPSAAPTGNPYAAQQAPPTQYGGPSAPVQQASPYYAQQPQYMQPYPNEKPWSALTIAGFICSIASLFVLGIILAPLGLILSILGFMQTNRGTHRGRGLAIAGIIIGGICTTIAVLGIVTGFAALTSL